MLMFKKITIAQHERALVWKDKQFVGVLESGKHRVGELFAQVDVQVYDLTVPEFEHARVDFLINDARSTVEKHFQIVELSEHEAGLVYPPDA